MLSSSLICKEIQKPHYGRVVMTIFFSMNSQNIFFRCLIHCLKVEMPSEYQKKLKMDYLGLQRLHYLFYFMS